MKHGTGFSWLVAIAILLSLAQPLRADATEISTLLATRAQEMAAGNVGLQAIIDYQTTLIAFSETDPEQAVKIRQTRDQCTALVTIGNLCELLTGTFAPLEAAEQ